MDLTTLLLLGLATWRLSAFLVRDTGPFSIFLRLRELAGITHDENHEVLGVPDRLFAGVLSCVWCASTWIGFGWLAFWLYFPKPALLLAAGFSLSTLAVLVDSHTK
jgi:hypothetical protein